MKIIDWLNEYHPSNSLEREHALREIMQEVTLAGLERSGFFNKDFPVFPRLRSRSRSTKTLHQISRQKSFFSSSPSRFT